MVEKLNSVLFKCVCIAVEVSETCPYESVYLEQLRKFQLNKTIW